MPTVATDTTLIGPFSTFMRGSTANRQLCNLKIMQVPQNAVCLFKRKRDQVDKTLRWITAEDTVHYSLTAIMILVHFSFSFFLTVCYEHPDTAVLDMFL